MLKYWIMFWVIIAFALGFGTGVIVINTTADFTMSERQAHQYCGVIPQ